MKSARRRSILHVDLDPFLVSVERSLDPSLRGRAVVVGGRPDGSGAVAAASSEARAAGVRVGQLLVSARRLCPAAAFRPGDLDLYARVSEDVTSILLAASRRVERPSADEAYVDLTRDGRGPAPVAAAEQIKDEIQRRLGLDASLGLASSRLAARVASRWARPRGLLVVLPGYETSFLARQGVDALPDLPPHLESMLVKGGYDTLGSLTDADQAALADLVGEPAATRLRQAARGEGEDPVEVAAPPAWVQEEAVIRDARTDTRALLLVIEGLAARVCRRLRPFGLAAGALTVEVRRADGVQRRTETIEPGLADEDAAARLAARVAEPLAAPASTVRAVQVRLLRLAAPTTQASLFPGRPGSARR